MCRLLGFAAPTPRSLTDVLGEEQTTRFQQMARLHDDGWGSLRRAPDGTLTRTRAADSGHDSEMLRADLRRSGATAEIVHLRLATDDMDILESNTHPFVWGRMGMAHNGSVVPVQQLREMLAPSALADIEGTTDSELYFALVRQHVEAGDSVPQALARSVLRLRAAYPIASLNAMLLTDEQLIVVRDSLDSVPPWDDFVASGLGEHELPLNHVDAYFRMHYRQDDDGTCVFSSVGLEFDGWHELPDAHLACVDLRSLEMTVSPLSQVAEPAHG